MEGKKIPDGLDSAGEASHINAKKKPSGLTRSIEDSHIYYADIAKDQPFLTWWLLNR